MAKIINFSPEFGDDIELGLKSSTIRDEQLLDRVSVGDDLKLFAGLGTSADERFLGEGVCTELEKLTIGRGFCAIGTSVLDAEKKQALAITEAFENYAELYAWLLSHYKFEGPFYGALMVWELKAQDKKKVAA